ncbi:hypothetical protein T484DRAFT_1945184 [Baffinella frigidus]|nr:hypothetical protein T484DRAFT_1945184 [Cryptophyta sp. CCMP2293]|mmetsp:Transcript_15434/g.37320  ORF Transcript_15434/g.37320 Transcript_15434/m.37320 type:complete len:147 (-) Transcript_15434:277-717(-)
MLGKFALLLVCCCAVAAAAKPSDAMGWVDAVPDSASNLENTGGALSAMNNAGVDVARRRAQGVAHEAGKIEGSLQKKLATLLAESVVEQKGGRAKATMDAALAGARTVGNGEDAVRRHLQRLRAALKKPPAQDFLERVSSFFEGVL